MMVHLQLYWILQNYKDNFKMIKKIIAIIMLIACSLAFSGCDLHKDIVHTAKMKDDDIWTITQYGPREMNLTFYTIHNPTKGLIVIDGGWQEDAPYVREIINSFGGHVDAWILTHPHPDHIGAFNMLLPELNEISISEVYTVELPLPEECLKVAPWDNMDAYNTFLEFDLPDIKYVYADDVIQIKDLKIEILSAYDENIAAISKDYLNDGSMMFRVYGEKESFLFCSDVGINVSDYLIEKYGKKLASDYLQMGHHGYGGLKDDFYQMVNPKTAFFDAPDWLMFDETGKYDNPENAELMKKMGSDVISFNSAPNQIVLK